MSGMEVSSKSAHPVRKHKAMASLAAAPGASKTGHRRFKRINSILQRAGDEFNQFMVRLRSLGEEVFTSDQMVNKLFVENDSDSLMDYLERSSKGYHLSEEIFLSEYKKYKNLDLMFEQNQLKNTSEDLKSFNTNTNSVNTRYSMKDLRAHKNVSSTSSPVPQEDAVDTSPLDIEDDDVLEEDASNEEAEPGVRYDDLDMSKMRQRMVDESEADESAVGEALWEFRRTKWLTPCRNHPTEANRVLANQAFEQIPKESYVKIYSSLVDKGKTLKEDRYINLANLMKVINAGWISQDKWERAAKGLA